MQVLKGLFYFLFIILLFFSGGFLWFGPTGLLYVAIIVLFLFGYFYFYSEHLIVTMYKAVLLEERNSLGLHQMVRRQIKAFHISMPRIYLTVDTKPYSFLVGRNRNGGALVVSQGLLGLLSQEELEAVVAHEMAHLKKGDIFYPTVSVALLLPVVRFVFGDQEILSVKFWQILCVILMMPWILLAISLGRNGKRELRADQGCVKFNGKPEILAQALQKIATNIKGLSYGNHLASSHIYVVNPLTCAEQSFKWLPGLKSGPSFEKRLKRLWSQSYESKN